MAARRARRQGGWQRYAAPAAFLLAVTIAVLLVRGSLRDRTETAATTTALPATTTAARATTTSRRRTGTPAAAARYHEVQAGDTFGSIAEQYGKTVDEIEELNPGVSSTSLHVGQRIRVR